MQTELIIDLLALKRPWPSRLAEKKKRASVPDPVGGWEGAGELENLTTIILDAIGLSNMRLRFSL